MTNETMREKLVAVANLLAELTGAVAEVAAEFGEVRKVEPTTEKPAEDKQPSMEEVRTVLAEISRAGKTAEMKALLGKFGASKLSDVKKEDYATLLAAAQEVRNA